MAYQEPTHEMSVRTTASSKSEGRLKVEAGSMKRKKKKKLKNVIKKYINY